MAPGGSHTSSWVPVKIIETPWSWAEGQCGNQEWSEADPAGPVISSLPSLYQSLGVFAILQNQRGSVGNWRITSQSP